MLLGVSQGLTWSTTVIMKIDLAGPQRRGLAMGLNEAAGYLAVAGCRPGDGICGRRLRPAARGRFLSASVFALAGLALSVFAVRETHGHAHHEAGRRRNRREPDAGADLRAHFAPRPRSVCGQPGRARQQPERRDGVGAVPVIFASAGLGLEHRSGRSPRSIRRCGAVCQLVTGGLSDRVGRKWLIAAGMWVQAAGIAVIAVGAGVAVFVGGSVLLGIGTAMVYPTLLAVIGDVAHPSWRASAVGVYRLWRDLGYAVGALVSGVTADLLGARPAAGLVAALTLGSGVVVALRLRETRGELSTFPNVSF